MAYATTAQLAARWRDLSPKETTIAAQLLDDAAVIIDASAEAANVPSEVLSIVSCNMVRRAMLANGDSFALGSQNDNAGQGAEGYAWTPYEAAGSVSEALWLSYSDRKLLRAYSGRYFTIRPKNDYTGAANGY